LVDQWVERMDMSMVDRRSRARQLGDRRETQRGERTERLMAQRREIQRGERRER
jgi:hypothetical protein